jgi:hypothetical protein
VVEPITQGNDDGVTWKNIWMKKKQSTVRSWKLRLSDVMHNLGMSGVAGSVGEKEEEWNRAWRKEK